MKAVFSSPFSSSISLSLLALSTLLLPGPARAESGATSRDPEEIVRRLEQEQTGVSLSGKAASRYQRAALDGASVQLGQPTVDNAAFTQAEVDLAARPGAHARGRLLFRLHQDWSNYYEEGPNPITARWFDFNGEMLDDHVHYAVGDFRARHSPLTLYAPGPELLNEPEIFADRRQTAMEEFFLGGERLPLQGLNIAFSRDSLAGGLGLSTDLALARLRNVHSGSTSFLHWTDDVEKLALASDWKLRFLDAVGLGYSQTYVYDDVAASQARNNSLALAEKGQLPRPLYENNQVNAFSLDLDGKRWLAGGKFSLSLQNEFALSSYQSSRDSLKDTLAYQVLTRDLEDLKGTALRAVFKAGYGRPGEGPFTLALRGAYLRNEQDFVSNLAQSPTFLGRRILNSRTSVGGPAGGYNTLDALYNHRYTVDPITSLSNSELWYIDAKTYNGTNNWYRAPFQKNSYNSFTTTKSEREALNAAGVLDPHVQLLFPFGPATPNRAGFTLDLDADFLSGALEATARYAGLEEMEAGKTDSLTAAPAGYTRMGGGLKLRLDKLAALPKSLVLSGSYVRDARARDAFSSQGVSVAGEDFAAAMIHAEVNAGLWKGLSLLAGYQSLQSNPRVSVTETATSRSATAGNLRQSQWSVGLECRITHGAFVTAEYGRLGLKESVTRTAYSQDVSSLTLLIAY